ncbi:MAG: TetR/AcrR family transcriptional regulator [Burkholderiales bacterium]|nr:TetR/AcrR family transcriptional regulator [Burkholderiales bacterium]
MVKAGLQVVSRHGYADASVSRIAEAAGVAAGTLYSYFESHQQLLDELLPAEGVRLLGVLAKSAHQSTDYFDHETRTFRAFITYLKRNPHFLRVLAEAETAAPRSHAQHMRNIEERYLRALHLAERRGEIRPHNDASFRVIAEVLAGARGHIAMGFCDRSGARSLRPKQIPEWVADTYVKFVRHGLGYAAALDLPRRMAASTQAPRPQLQQGTRASLINSAARVINRSGYLGATVQAITQAAGVAVGTFYAHFRSQRELFEELLCSMRTQMQAEVAEAIRGSRSFVELESRGFTGFFDYLVRNPWYVRVGDGGGRVGPCLVPPALLRHRRSVCQRTAAKPDARRAEDLRGARATHPGVHLHGGKAVPGQALCDRDREAQAAADLCRRHLHRARAPGSRALSPRDRGGQ